MKLFNNMNVKLSKIPVLFIVTMFFTFLNGLLASTAFAVSGVAVWTDRENYINGEEVTVYWTIPNIAVENCVLAGPDWSQNLDTSSLPTSGEYSYYPEDVNTMDHTLTCNRETSVVAPAPVVPSGNAWIDGGDTKYLDLSIGRVPQVKVRWNVTNADKCGNLYYKSSATGNVWTIVSGDEDISGSSGNRGTNGNAVFDGDPRSIDRTTDFGITCYNLSEGTNRWLSTRVNVPGVPSERIAPTAAIWVRGGGQAKAVMSKTYGNAWLEISHGCWNADRCDFDAKVNGVSVRNWSNNEPPGVPEGWRFWSQTFSANTWVNFSTSTTLLVRARQEAQSYNGTHLYDAVSSDWKKLDVEVVYPNGTDYRSWVRLPETGTPAVTITATATPNPTVRNKINGLASTVVTLNPRNANYCYLRAYGDSDGDGIYTNEYDLPSWTRTNSGNRLAGNTDHSITVNDLTTSTRLNIYCWRPFDTSYGDADEVANGTESYNFIVEVEEPASLPNPPETFVYGNAVTYTAQDMWAQKTHSSGYDGQTMFGTWQRLLVDWQAGAQAGGGDANPEISFKFKHPFGEVNTYDVYFYYCDESDGVSTFKLLVNDEVVGEKVSDLEVGQSNVCGGSGTLRRAQFAKDVVVAHNDKITVKCTTPRNDGERCSFGELFFGAGNDSSVVARMDPVTNKVSVPISWWSWNADTCDAQWSRKLDGSNGEPGDWSTAPWVRYFGDKPTISTSTTFYVRCKQTYTGLTDTSKVTVYVPFRSIYTATTRAFVGECIDDGTWGTIGQVIDPAPEGFGPDPITRYCVPLLDFKIDTGPSLSASSVDGDVDNVAGTHDEIDIQFTLRNIDSGTLREDSEVPYLVVNKLDSQLSLADVESNHGAFNDELGPAGGGNDVSGTLTRSFQDMPFGNHEACARVNLDDAVFPIYPELHQSVADNQECKPFFLPVPEPPMSISSDEEIVSSGQPVTIDWSINVAYSMSCTVQGPGGIDVSFSTDDASGEQDSDRTTTPLTSSGEYIFQCNEPITDTTFTRTVRVEVVPGYEEN